ncbi:hypothetical protein IEO21_07189 [Rhodonia placenta]|uniref:Potassium transport protein n=1 Tax=Rhodonia placenta TaxID=104341 RepID=A0A8H7TZW9_9APHY|nr:hypothetical protein IEO21_07189 [Postia placenta]
MPQMEDILSNSWTLYLFALTAWQQAIIVILELTGNQAFTSWVVVYFRRRYFLKHLEHIVIAESERGAAQHDRVGEAPSLRTIRDVLLQRSQSANEEGRARRNGLFFSAKDDRTPIRPEMVRRVDVEPHRIDPTGRQASPYTSAVDEHIHGGADEALWRTASRSDSLRTDRSPSPSPRNTTEDDLGGFPDPPQVLSGVLRALFPGLHNRLRRRMMMPRTETLVPQASIVDGRAPSSGRWKAVSYLPFSATVGRNSAFRGLSAEQIDQLGGIEYRALTALLWIVPLYYFGLLAISFVVIAPYMTLPRWQYLFAPPEQHRKINSIWFSAFQVIGAWANTGMSLVDQNMVPFREAYPMIIFLVICVLAGNSALIIGHATDVCVLLFSLTAFVFDLILNLGNPVTDSIPAGVRVINAVLAAAGVRSSGFQSISVSTLTPANHVRSTNVYEERALGIYTGDHDDVEDNINEKEWRSGQESRVAIWGRYILRHARKQLSIDMWWLSLSLFFICIIERSPLMNTDNASWFNIWAIIFEIVSAYGTVGLSLGVSYANYSLSGAFHTLSKLIICLVMIRGRHRDLPVALDRAIMLPREFQRHEDDGARVPGPISEASSVQKEHEPSTLKSTSKAESTGRVSFAEDDKRPSRVGTHTLNHISEVERGDESRY